MPRARRARGRHLTNTQSDPRRSATGFDELRVDLRVLDRICHELRRPLSSALAYVELLQDGISGPVNAAQRAQLSAVRGSLIELERQFSSAYSTFEALDGNLRVDTGSLDLVELARALMEEFRERCTRAKPKLVLHTHSDPLHVRGDEHLLAEALRAVVDNALRYGRDGDEVELLIDASGDHATLSVLDRGPGFDEAELERVFQCFYRAERGSRVCSQGLGLGLPRARALLRALGGSLRISNRLGGGACVDFELARLESAAETPRARPSAREP